MEQDELKDKVEDELTRAQAAYGAISVIGGIPGLIIMGFTFDAPGSEKELFSWLLFFSYPAFVIITVITCFIANRYLRQGLYQEARRMNKVPFLWIIGLITLFILYGMLR
ncbi:hypothetical protein [Bacillus sp. B-jedd]|uniref:hypothetical protein n=1 Tax=Bacillus sp. B-jedd TaxID=1476857 RepID=UPI0005156E01|nr:hypothetical protein [Bacillus sp. B-jedd]CEG27195.1 hypothetical protein BN1002_02051 [Bacillus sp. B-jedd]